MIIILLSEQVQTLHLRYKKANGKSYMWIRWTPTVSRKEFHLPQRASQGRRGRARSESDGTRWRTGG